MIYETSGIGFSCGHVDKLIIAGHAREQFTEVVHKQAVHVILIHKPSNEPLDVLRIVRIMLCPRCRPKLQTGYNIVVS